MLARNFKTASDLRITEKQLSALKKTLVLLETGKLSLRQLDSIEFEYTDKALFSGEFNMGTFGMTHKCGTVACIAGTAEIVGGVDFVGQLPRPDALDDLFFVHGADINLDGITPSQAATALRSYLTTGDARWDLAVLP